MSALVVFDWLVRQVRRLPAPVVFALDTWSEGLALRRAERRRRRAALRKAMSAAAK